MKAQLFSALALVAVVGCSKPDKAGAEPAATGSPATAAKSGTPTAARMSGVKVDRTASQDGALTGDSADDGVLSLAIDGPVSALALVSVDGSGKIDGASQWDTIVEQQPIPVAWKSPQHVGADTWQLGVEENGKMLNAKNGSVPALGAGPHKLTLYVGDGSHFTPGSHFMVLAERPDHSVVQSNVVKM